LIAYKAAGSQQRIAIATWLILLKEGQTIGIAACGLTILRNRTGAYHHSDLVHSGLGYVVQQSLQSGTDIARATDYRLKRQMCLRFPGSGDNGFCDVHREIQQENKQLWNRPRTKVRCAGKCRVTS
jgi:hypothetical protein